VNAGGRAPVGHLDVEQRLQARLLLERLRDLGPFLDRRFQRVERSEQRRVGRAGAERAEPLGRGRGSHLGQAS
jgi:hypothetical protein